MSFEVVSFECGTCRSLSNGQAIEGKTKGSSPSPRKRAWNKLVVSNLLAAFITMGRLLGGSSWTLRAASRASVAEKVDTSGSSIVLFAIVKWVVCCVPMSGGEFGHNMVQIQKKRRGGKIDAF